MAVSVVGVAFEHQREPFGIGEARPRISWRLAADGAAADEPGWLSWVRRNGRLEVDVVVPVGAIATVRLPDPAWTEAEVGPGRHRFVCPFRRVEEDPARPPAPPPLGLQPEAESGLFEA